MMKNLVRITEPFWEILNIVEAVKHWDSKLNPRYANCFFGHNTKIRFQHLFQKSGQGSRH